MQKILLLPAFLIFTFEGFSQYHPVEHSAIKKGEVAVTTGGSFADAGTTCVLTKNITGDRSTIFLGKDVTLDLNGYTVRFADAGYEHIQNSGFEEGLKGWDLSQAPGAKLENTANVHVFLGKKLLSLRAGDEIDIRPAMDAGISIIEKTTPLADYDHVIMESYPPTIPAFYDYTGNFRTGGENYVYDNNITVNKTDTSSRVLTAALYICGGPEYFGGQFYHNSITTNVPAAWIASMYGGASNTCLYDNTVIPADNTLFSAFRIGTGGCNECVAKNIRFRSNHVVGRKFELSVTDQDHSYTVSWKLTINVKDKSGVAAKKTGVTIIDNSGKVAFKGQTDTEGKISADLPEYAADGRNKKVFSPYTVITGQVRRKVILDDDRAILIQ